ncbi:MAG: ParB/RepB/Spo0J family partition protein [Geobacter sp.]|nr:ParB/RepB/Spo0J family partition protein [Geobacter sp.]
MEQLSIFDILNSMPQEKQPEQPLASSPALYLKGNLYQIPLTRLVPDPAQPRKYFDEQALTELQVSLKRHGVLQPILVREGQDGAYVIVSGERRFQAARNLALESVPALVIDGEPAEIAIIENLLRENLTAIEEAEAIERLRTLHDYSLNDLSQALGKANSTISEILSLNRLPEAVKDDCRNDPKAARRVLAVIARQKSPESMASLYTKYKERGLTRGEIVKKTTPKQVRKQLAAKDVAAFSERLDRIIVTDMAMEQKQALIVEMEKLRTVCNQQLKLLKTV